MFKLAEVAIAAGVETRTLSNWLDRRIIDIPAFGSGNSRRFTKDDVIQIAIIAELTRLGVSVGEASKGAATYADDAGADRDASEPFPQGRTLLIIDEDGARCVNVSAPREQFEAAMLAVYGEARSTIVVNVAGVIANVERALETGHADNRPRGAVYRYGRELHA